MIEVTKYEQALDGPAVIEVFMTFEVRHGLGTLQVYVECFDDQTRERILPHSVIFEDKDTVLVSLPEASVLYGTPRVVVIA